MILFCLISLNLFSDTNLSSLLAKAYFDRKEVAIIQLAFDGVNTTHSGVGTVVANTTKILSELNAEREKKFKLYLISAKYSEELPEYCLYQLQKNQQLCQRNGGDVYLIPVSKNNEMFGDPQQWKELCEQSADLCISLINQNQHTIILAHDTAYAQVPLKIFQKSSEIKRSYQSIWIPHAISWKYNGHTLSGKPLWPERHYWELEALNQAEKCGYKVGYIHNSMKNSLLSKPFSGNCSILMLYPTGIFLDKYLQTYSENEIKQELVKRNIPLNKRLIFSIGRANPLKGQDISLEVYRHLKQIYSDIHLVLLAPSSDYMPEYFDILKRRILDEELDVTLLDNFDSNIDAYVYQWKNTVIACLLSRVDTQPLTMMEARANPNRCILLASNSCFSGSNVLHGKDGYLCSLEGLADVIKDPIEKSSAIKKIVQIADEILSLPKEKRNAIVNTGKELVATHFDLRKNIKRSIEYLLESVVSPLSWNFRDVLQGMINPPRLVTLRENSPIGVLKEIKKNQYESMSVRLKLLQSIQNQGYFLFPKIFQSWRGESIAGFKGRNYYLMEYLPPDFFPVTMEEMLVATGKLHQVTEDVSIDKILDQSKLKEFYERSRCFQDLWFCRYNRQVFSGKNWEAIVTLADFFSSKSFLTIYEQLPKKLLHGDNNQTNVIKFQGQIYFIDLDSLRYDVRLLDLASYFRYGGFPKYLNLLKNKKLEATLYQYYTPYTQEFLPIEKEMIHSIVLFSHIEFISWAMKKLKQAVVQNSSLENCYLNLIIQYKDQIQELTQALSLTNCR